MNKVNSEEIAIFDLKKKRKLQAEQLGLPKPKHKSLNRSFTTDASIMFDENPQRVQLHTQIIKTKAEDEDPASTKYTNTFAGDSESTISICGESNLESDHSIPCRYSHRPSTSSASLISNTLINSHCSADSMEQDSVHENDCIEEFANEDYEDLVYTNEGNQNMFVLSSGRWTVSSESENENGPKKPTIDQEFEQYFSMLLL